MPILPPLPRPQRRRIHKIIHATRDKGHARRLMAILLLHEGRTITDVHHLTGAARSTIGRWLRWYRDEGIDALEALTGWPCPSLTYRQDCHPTGAAHAVFSARFWLSAQPLVYWTIGYKNQSVNGAQCGSLHAPPMVTSYGHCLAQARADLADKRPSLSGKMANIDAALACCDADNPVFYEDEVDIDLNPKLEPTGCSERSKAGCHRGRMPSIIWQAFSTQATEGYFTSAGSRKLIAVYCHAGKAAPPLPTSQNHHVDPR